MSRDPILPGATLGMVGSGQLGRMFAQAAQRMGYRVAVLGPGASDPACQIADEPHVGDWSDPEAVARLARASACVTVEFENVSVPALEAASELAPLRPSPRAIAAAQDRRLERAELARLHLPCPAYAVIEREEDLAPARERTGTPAILKTARSGYDGKGQRRVEGPAELGRAWDELGRVPCVLEALVEFEAELSVVGARSANGEIALYEPCRNEHVNHILDVSVVPAELPEKASAEAARIARELLSGLDYVGVLCVELFLLPDGSLRVNEIAPRPHNSGHLTIEGHATSQFEQQVRAVCGLPLGSTERTLPAVAMANLLGDLWTDSKPPDWEAALAQPGLGLHLYGKTEARSGRKMGHLTVGGASAADAAEAARAARERLRRTLTVG